MHCATPRYWVHPWQQVRQRARRQRAGLSDRWL